MRDERANVKKIKYAEKPTAETSTMKTMRTTTMAAPTTITTTTNAIFHLTFIADLIFTKL